MTVAPLREALGKVETHLRELEHARVSAYAALSEQVGFMRSTGEELRDQTSSLVHALRAPQARGRWGEMQLRRVVELAGMVEHCDFTEQATVTSDHGTLRPDLVVRLAGGKQVVVDAKVSLAAYLDAAESRDPDLIEARMDAHARHLREHVKGLAAKEYWRSFEPTPEFVVLFVPGDAFLAPALERDPQLLEDAMAAKVLIATPTTLIAMLRTIAYSWQQEALTANARSVFELGRELYRRLGTLGGHVDKVGRSLSRSVEDYNSMVGSLERTVLTQARRMAELQVTDADLPRPDAAGLGVPTAERPRAARRRQPARGGPAAALAAVAAAGRVRPDHGGPPAYRGRVTMTTDSAAAGTGGTVPTHDAAAALLTTTTDAPAATSVVVTTPPPADSRPARPGPRRGRHRAGRRRAVRRCWWPAASLLDLSRDATLGLGTGLAFVLAALAAPAVVRFRSLPTAAVLPPLLFVGAAAAIARLSGQNRGSREVVLDVATTLALSAPLLFGGAAAALVVVLVRVGRHLAARR